MQLKVTLDWQPALRYHHTVRAGLNLYVVVQLYTVKKNLESKAILNRVAAVILISAIMKEAASFLFLLEHNLSGSTTPSHIHFR
jgi:hypothetical protein